MSATAITTPEREGPVARPARLTGPRFIVLSLVTAMVTAAISIAARGGASLEALKATLTLISHIASVVFLVVFVARPLNDLMHNKTTRWLMKNRRYVGDSFAAWHLQHFWLIPWIAALAGPEKFFGTFHERGKLIPATIVLLLITAMAATSSNRAQRALGRGWRVLHKIGIYAIFIWFVQVYVWSWFNKGEQPYTLVFTAAFGLALAVRWWADVKRLVRVRARRRQRVAS